MRLLVTGAKGQLGTDVVHLLSASHKVYAPAHRELDVTNGELIKAIVRQIRPDAIIHTAAYTAVDQAEEDHDRAYMVNAEGSRNVALAARDVNAKLCAISTDYVFDGKTAAPYDEQASPNPRTVYGASKLLGENYIRESMTHYFIVRTSWVFGAHGDNFVRTMLRLGQSGQSLKVVDDQFGSPTYTQDLAEFLHALIQSDRFGVYHATNTGVCSWYEFAQEIFRQMTLTVDLKPCSTEEFSRPASRPQYSALAHTALQANGFQEFPSWQDALRRFLTELRQNSEG